jgi:hypothetical protein
MQMTSRYGVVLIQCGQFYKTAGVANLKDESIQDYTDTIRTILSDGRSSEYERRVKTGL